MIRLCEKNDDECKVCTESKCNSRASFIKCFNCNSTEDQQCVENPQLGNSKVCEYYYDECFTHIGDYSVSRGCIGDKDKQFITRCRTDRDKCDVCDTLDENGCNNQTITLETCVECDSVKDSRCHEEPEIFTNKICSRLQSVDRPGCYLSVVS